MRCKYCRKLIIHRFNRNYTKRDKKRKRQHERRCKENPNIKPEHCKHPNLSDNKLKAENIGKEFKCNNCGEIYVVIHNSISNLNYHFLRKEIYDKHY